MTTTLAEAIALRDNDHRAITAAFAAETGQAWHDPTPPELAHAAVSVVMPARDNAHSLHTVLDALDRQVTHGRVEVVVVDDASTDHTPDIIATHPRVDTAVRLREQAGSGAARNVGIHLATTDTILFLDADMVLPGHVLADVAARARPDVVLVGFRHNIAFHAGPDGNAQVPAGRPDPNADHRVRWSPPAGVPMFHTGQIYDAPFVGHPLDDTHDFIDLGLGQSYFDWDLPRMFVTALASAPRDALLDVGGFHERFGPDGWGAEDTHLGAALIAAGCKTIPLRQTIGWHIDPPNADTVWQRKYASAAARIAQYRALLETPPPRACHEDLTERAQALIRKADTLK